MEVKEYLCADNRSPFANWFDGLNSQAALKVNTCLTRMGNGNLSSLKSVGSGVHECRIDWGPGYVYLGKDGEKLVILLGGGTKKRQQKDIDQAKELWKEYKKRKKEP
ncbi:MAG: type II toxin-antitoxin system RelE/ParE family toxin [Nitrospinales bacterium]